MRARLARLAAWLLLLIGPAAGARGDWAEVTVEALDVLDEPDPTAFVTGRLRRGDRVSVREARDGGWLAIEPPSDSFGWIDRETIEDLGGGAGRVAVDEAVVRSGSATGQMPGPPDWILPRGATVRLLGRGPLTLRQSSGRRTWLAIESPPGTLRFVRARGVGLGRERSEHRPAQRPEPNPPASDWGPASPRSSIDPGLRSAGPTAAEEGLTTSLIAALAPIEARHRAILARPVETWDLESVRRGYQTLLEREPDPAAQSALRARLARLDRQETLARSAREFLDQARRGPRVDSAPGEDRPLADPGPDRDQAPDAYDAVGLLQVSSRRHEGQTIFALIGSRGETLAFLRVPPGLRAENLLTRRVGIRGSTRYSEPLRADLIEVRELDVLGGAP